MAFVCSCDLSGSGQCVSVAGLLCRDHYHGPEGTIWSREWNDVAGGDGSGRLCSLTGGRTFSNHLLYPDLVLRRDHICFGNYFFFSCLHSPTRAYYRRRTVSRREFLGGG